MTTVLLRGGRVRTPLAPHATAMLVEDGAVAWVGADGEAAGLAADRTVRLGGALVTPAFVDAHVHATATGLGLDGLDLAGSPTMADMLERLARYARGRRGEVILGAGWDETTWPERRAPTPFELDRAAGGAAVYLARIDAHSALVSAALLARCPEARSLPGFDPEGQLRLAAHHAARRTAFASVTAAGRRAAQRATRARAAELGIGCLHEMSGPDIAGGEEDLAALLALAAAEPGPGVVAYWGVLGDVWAGDRHDHRLAGVGGDLFIDGALGSHTAALHDPYADRPDHLGDLRFTAEQVAEHVIGCVRAGVQAGFHAIGDRAIDTVLDGYAWAARTLGVDALAASRPRIEHAEMPSATAIDRMARLGVVASVQPAFDATWAGPDRMYTHRLGEARAAAMNPFAAFARAGVPLALGSDSPVTPLDPWEGVRAAVHQRAGQGLTPGAAFDAATRGGWHAAGRFDQPGAGTLVPGAPASYAVWDTGDGIDDGAGDGVPDPATGLPDLAPDAPLPTCLRTVVRGQVVYDREGALT
jgi:predicted amidohydrolase YtcJ